MSRPSAALVASWYARLRRGGFVDVEGGRDLNQLDAWTFRGGSDSGNEDSSVRTRRSMVSLSNRLDDTDDAAAEPATPLADAPQAQYWRLVGIAAHEVPTVTPRRNFILLAAELGNVEAARRHYHLSRRQARTAWSKFLRRAGLSRG